MMIRRAIVDELVIDPRDPRRGRRPRGLWNAQPEFPNVPDWSGNGTDGLMTNMSIDDCVLDAPRGLYSRRSVLLNGSNQSILMGPDFGYEYTDPFSLTYWFQCRPSGVGGFSVTKMDTVIHRGYAIGVNAGNSYAIDFHLRNSHPGNRILVQSTTNGLDDGLWHHMGATWDGNASPGAAGVTLYIDGAVDIPVVVENTLSASITTAGKFNIGARNAVNAFWDGKLSEVAVYGKELSLAEIGAVYNAGVPRNLRTLASFSSLAGYWRPGEAHR